MKSYKVGPNDLYWDSEDVNPEHFDWVVYYYEQGGYDGSGTLVGKAKTVGRKNLYEVYDLGHCSCYGPMENGPSYTLSGNRELRRFFKQDPEVTGRKRHPSDYRYDEIVAIWEVVSRLLSGNAPDSEIVLSESEKRVESVYQLLNGGGVLNQEVDEYTLKSWIRKALEDTLKSWIRKALDEA